MSVDTDALVDSSYEKPGEADGFKTLPEKVADDLRRRILLGDFKPGANIPERETSAELGVSRTPLREALRILANEGLVVIRPARSPVVADPSGEELSQLFSVMRVLEGLAGEQTCMNASAAEIRGIRQVFESMAAVDNTRDPVSFFNVDMAFHRSIVVASGNAPLIKTHEAYNARLWRARYLTSQAQTDRERIIREHGEILAGIEARDTRWTSVVMDSHLRSANRKILDAQFGISR